MVQPPGSFAPSGASPPQGTLGLSLQHALDKQTKLCSSVELTPRPGPEGPHSPRVEGGGKVVGASDPPTSPPLQEYTRWSWDLAWAGCRGRKRGSGKGPAQPNLAGRGGGLRGAHPRLSPSDHPIGEGGGLVGGSHTPPQDHTRLQLVSFAWAGGRKRSPRKGRTQPSLPNLGGVGGWVRTPPSGPSNHSPEGGGCFRRQREESGGGWGRQPSLGGGGVCNHSTIFFSHTFLFYCHRYFPGVRREKPISTVHKYRPTTEVILI